ncbi:MAG TPA: DUF6051 family protein [Bacteroidales bacterium]|nr:DUF6051 family protein [Bacteroidales bacterium]HPT22289.1 DUF6051 family protein [Bacteroidales bacterium]
MEYTKKYNEFKSVFNPEMDEINIPGSKIKIHNVKFCSDTETNNFSNINDTLISENRSFSYPVFAPENRDSKKVILLLHGLNERSWVKYLVWAFYLAQETESYVVLFPICFHINRSPDSWKDPRKMLPAMQNRKAIFSQANMSSFANVALSNRLTEDPLRFFSSGCQTAEDIIKLVQSIRNGEHDLIPAGCQINIFAYSIGAFLSEIILMGNPGNLFSESKLFIFCGGSVFSHMQGTSKLIMDSLAFDRVYAFYMHEFENTIKGTSPLVDFLRNSKIGMAFRSMIDITRFKSLRENILRNLKGQIHSVNLVKDTVIPSTGVLATLSSWNNDMKDVVEIWDFPYPYSHENPFPIFNSPLYIEVDNSFERVFSTARSFLA